MGEYYTESPIFPACVFQCNGKVIFYHSYYHQGISSTLAFQMVYPVSNEQMGICNYLSAFRLMLISLLDNLGIFRITGSKNFINQRNHQSRHLFQHRSKNIVKYSVIAQEEAPFLRLCIVIFCISGLAYKSRHGIQVSIY